MSAQGIAALCFVAGLVLLFGVALIDAIEMVVPWLRRRVARNEDAAPQRDRLVEHTPNTYPRDLPVLNSPPVSSPEAVQI